MNTYVSHTNSDFAVAHFPGEAREKYSDILDSLKEEIVYPCENVTLVSIITDNIIDSSPLNYQLVKNGINYINPAQNKRAKWSNPDKIKYIIDALAEVNTEYVLIMDGADSIICGDISKGIDVLSEYGVEILFNASTWMFPPILIDYVTKRYSYGDYNYLNAGCCFGKLEALKDFYSEVYNEYTKSILAHEERNNPWKASSEQYWVRKVFDVHQDTVFFDYDCKFFQIFHATSFVTEGDIIKVI